MNGLPGVRDPIAALEWLALGVIAVITLTFTCHSVGDHRATDQFQKTIAALRNTAQEATLARDSAVHAADIAREYAAAQHALTVQALERADSLGKVAAQLHARVRATDATHVAVTRGDTTIVYAVPPEVPERFASDSAALAATAALYWSQHRELDVVETENRALWQAEAADSIRFRAQAAALAAWPAEARRQRWQGRKEGAAVALAVVAAAKLVTLVLR